MQQDFSKLTDVTQLAFELINIESITLNEAPKAKAISGWLQSRGWIVEKQIYSTDPLRYNILAYPSNITNPSTQIDILFNTHIDTVPPYIPASYSKNKDNEHILCGRGACDTSGIIASQLIATQELYNKYNIKNIGLLFVIGEETDHCGIKFANKLNLNPQYFICGEPTDSQTVIAQKGALKFNLYSKGKASHSSLPHLGIDAIDPLLKILYHLKVIEKWPTHKIIGNTTFNIGVISGGTAGNTVPSKCRAELYFRTASNTFKIQKRVKDIIKLYDNQNQIRYELLSCNNPSMYDSIGKEFDPKIVGFNTDIPDFEPYKNNKLKGTVLFGPGSITVAHSDNEHIIIQELKESVGKYVQIVKKLISGKYDKRSKL